MVSSSRLQSTSWQGLQRSSSGLRAWSPSHRGPAQERSVSVMRSVAFYQQTHNNALEQTRRVGVPASRAVVGVPPCSSTQCCAYLCGGQIKKPSATMRAALRKDTNGVALRRGGQLARRSATWFRRRACRQLLGKGPNGHRRASELGSPRRRGPAQERSVSVMRSVAFYQQTHNNALERTRRGGVPAARAVFRVSPRRSTRCYTGCISKC